MTFRNTNERFGDTLTTYEAPSAESIADEMMPTLRTWAAEQGVTAEALRSEFLDGLEQTAD
jgi:hypothetical protein